MPLRELVCALAVVFIVLAMPVLAGAQDCLEAESTKPCGSNIGACESGTQTCQDGGWTDCEGGVEPILEICDNGIDDDCDALTDECLESVWPLMIMVGVLLLFVMLMLIKMGF